MDILEGAAGQFIWTSILGHRNGPILAQFVTPIGTKKGTILGLLPAPGPTRWQGF